MELTSLPSEFIEAPVGQKPYLVPPNLTGQSSLADVLAFARAQDASDVHITPNNPIFLRKYSRLSPISNDLLTAPQIETLLKTGVPEAHFTEFQNSGDHEFVFTVPGSGRFRMTIIRQRFGIDITARIIPNHILPFEETGMPESCKSLTDWAQGLVLVTGPSGCGKTTTLSSLVNMINQTRPDHIITIENPIEHIYRQEKCQITQREIGRHTMSQTNALRAALREDPDIIVVSELRDLDSIQLAVTAAETGHLVFGTMNTNDAVQTITKLIFSFPADERSVITNMISESLRGVISQQLVPRANGKGMVPAYEVLIVNNAIANMIRKTKFQQINNVMAVGKSAGMVLLENSLQQLVTDQTIHGVEAYLRLPSSKIFEQYASKLEKGAPVGKD